MIEKKGINVAVVVILSILFLIVGLLVGYIITSNGVKCDEVKEENKETVEKEEVDETALLNEITIVYTSAFSYINSGDLDIGSDLSKLDGTKQYFTSKALDYISRKNGSSNMIFFAGIFGTTDQGRRPLTIVSYNDDTVIATGQLIKGTEEAMYDADNYPLYIIFKKENNSWKIDLFE